MSELITGEEALHIKTDVTLEQLEEFQSAGRAGVAFDTAVGDAMDDFDIKDRQIIEQLRYAHSVGIDDKRHDIVEASARLNAKEAKEERVYTEKETIANAKNFLDPTIPFIMKHMVDDNPINGQKMTNKPIAAAFEEMKKKVMDGDEDYLYDCILSQMGQMQQMSLKLNQYMGNTSRVDTTLKYANMQIKLMAEQRRTIQTLADLMNPKKTTFVKEVSQHNHFTEKKSKSENEKQNTLETSSQSLDNNTKILEAKYAKK